MKRTFATVCFLLLVGLAAAVGMWQIALAAPDPPRVEPEPQRVLTVDVARLAPSAPTRPIRAQGRLAERSRSPLVAEATGRLVWVAENWSPGLLVTAGTPLWKLDDTDLRLEEQRLAAQGATLQAQREQARANQTRAERTAELEAQRVTWTRAEVDRWQRLVDEQRGTPSQLDQARVQWLSAQRLVLDAEENARAAQLEEATLTAKLGELDAEQALLQERLTRLEGKAPIDGFWLDPAPAVGQWVLQGQTLGAVQSNASPRILCEVGEAQWARLAIGATARIVWPASGKETTARLISLGTAFRTQSGEITVELEWMGEPAVWRPGQAIVATFQGKPLPEGLWIEARSVAWREGQAGLYLFVEGEAGGHRARFVPLTLGHEQAGGYPVIDSPTGTVLLGRDWIPGPLDRLFDGAPVQRRSEAQTP